MEHFKIKKLMIFVAIILLYLNRIQGMKDNQDIGKIEDDQDIKTKELWEILEDWIKMLKATKDRINAKKDIIDAMTRPDVWHDEKKAKMNAMTEHDFEDEKFIYDTLLEAKKQYENLLEAKMQHKFNIYDKFDELKEINPNAANALLEKHQELTEFVTPPELETPRLLKVTKDVQMMKNESPRCDVCYEDIPVMMKVAACGHEICLLCYEELNEKGHKTCPMCRTSFDTVYDQMILFKLSPHTNLEKLKKLLPVVREAGNSEIIKQWMTRLGLNHEE